jgi:drug/metabolite transporter (DMT)-like permease
MIWLVPTVIGHVFNAGASLVGKFLLQKLISHPAVYAFWVSVFGLVALIFVPFGFSLPAPAVLAVSAASGALYAIGLVLLYFALQKSEASRIMTLVGGMSSVFVLGAAAVGLGERLSVLQIAGFFVILIGTYVISEKFGKPGLFLGKNLIWASAAAALLFALSNVATKWIYMEETFVNGFIWRSIGALAGCLILLLVPAWRREITASFKKPRIKTEVIFVMGQISSFIGFVLVNYATSLGSVSLVQALSGTQYLFLFFMAWPISKKYPHLFEEGLKPSIIYQKIVSLILVAAGIGMLFL